MRDIEVFLRLDGFWQIVAFLGQGSTSDTVKSPVFLIQMCVRRRGSDKTVGIWHSRNKNGSIMTVHGRMVCFAHTCAWWNSVHLLCFHQPFFLGQDRCVKAEECAFLCREKKWHWLCFMMCVRHTVLGHLSHLILTKACAGFFGCWIWIRLSLLKWDPSPSLF